MKPTTELLKFHLVFSQHKLLTPEEFLLEYKRRYLRANPLWTELETLHREQIFFPLFRFSKNVRAILSSYKRSDPPSLLREVALSTANLLGHYWDGYDDVGSLYDPRKEPYRPWKRYRRKLDHGIVWTSDFLYSPYQLLMLPAVRSLFRRMRSRRLRELEFTFSLQLDDREKKDFQQRFSDSDQLVVLLTALDTRYRPRVMEVVTNLRDGSLDTWSDYDRNFDPTTMLESLDWDVEKIPKQAEKLLSIANSFDPLSEWYELIRLCRPEKWSRLRGDALLASDYRIAAEILLLFYEDLVKADAAPPLEPLPKYFWGPRHTRLGTHRQDLDAVLMDFGISPQPSLVLVLEGDTEMLLVPRVMELLGFGLQSDRLKLFNAGGVDRDFGVLARFAATPQLGEAVKGIGRGFRLTRPPTHFLVVVDPESGFLTPPKCEGKRKAWVDDIWSALPKPYRTKIPKSEIDQLVEVQTWDAKGQSFEFAHFTDHQIARAILRAYKGSSAPPISDLQRRVAIKREHADNIESLWKRGWSGIKPSKLRVAEELWPVLKRRVNHAISRDTYAKIPIVRVILHAIRQANRLHRHSVMIRSS